MKSARIAQFPIEPFADGFVSGWEWAERFRAYSGKRIAIPARLAGTCAMGKISDALVKIKKHWNLLCVDGNIKPHLRGPVK